MGLKTLLTPATRLILLAAAAGLAAGALAVYVTRTPEGNNALVAGSSDSACAAKAELARSVVDAATGEVAAMLAASPPQSLAALAFNAPDGRPMTLADLGGRTVLLNLWATWCAPCRAEMPALDRLQQVWGGERFEVVAVNVDTGGDDKPKAFLAETGIARLAYYRDNTLRLFNDLKRRGLVLGLPATLLIDGEGCLLAHMNGPAAWDGADALRLLDAVPQSDVAAQEK